MFLNTFLPLELTLAYYIFATKGGVDYVRKNFW